jgi:hypothetical protein
MFEKKVFRRIFGPVKEDVTGDWRRLHNELNKLYFFHFTFAELGPLNYSDSELTSEIMNILRHFCRTSLTGT